MMEFKLIDMDKWDRKDCFNHFMNVAKSTYSVTVNVDISHLYKIIKEQEYRFYPVFTWIVTKAINNHEQFRMGFNETGSLGYYDKINATYSVLNEKTKNMDSLCTEYKDDFNEFYNNMVSDMDNYKSNGTLTEMTYNFFIVSCLPWLSYTSFQVNNESEMQFLFPMITWGKYFKQEDKVLLPLSFQINHAVADGYHCSLFYNDIDIIVSNFEEYINN